MDPERTLPPLPQFVSAGCGAWADRFGNRRVRSRQHSSSHARRPGLPALSELAVTIQRMKISRLTASAVVSSFLCAVLSFISASSVPAVAQYTDAQAMADLGGPKEFERRRQALAQEILAQDKNGGWLVLFARQLEPEADHYREDNDFYYLTGIADPGAVFAISAESGQALLFERAQAPRVKQVYGANVLSLSAAEQKALGFALVLPLTD